jgi:FkbM family methyltransferase
MKNILKKIRSILIINLIFRVSFNWLIELGRKLFQLCSLHWPISGVVVINLPDKKVLKIYSKADDFIPSQVYWKGYDGYEYAIIPFYYLSKELSTIIDIGANIGYYSLVAATANPLAKVVSFEPVDRIVHRFKKQIEVNGFSNIKIEKKIVGDKNDHVKFYIPKGSEMALASSTKKGWVTDVDEEVIQSTTLDSYKIENRIDKIELIKMDCEFHELEVLKGMENILSSDKPIIMIEILFPTAKGVEGHFESNQHVEIEKLMLDNGYYFYLITKQALFRVDKLEYNELDRNYIFSSKKSKNRYIPYSQINSII